MCGIAGIWGVADEYRIRKMVGLLGHRGPDSEGVYMSPGLGGMGCCRLAIMDPAGGHMPLFNEDRSRVVVANGEIYNFPALRRELSGRHKFVTGSDCEAIVHLHDEMGDAAAAGLDGMFAYALAEGDRLLLVRDPLGIKPLYYGFEPGPDGRRVLHFASELKALACATFPVRAVPPGSMIDDTGTLTTYYQVPLHEPVERAPAEWASRVREALAASVKRHLMSDVPVGVLLSGGLDSSIIAALARQHIDGLHSFAVGFEGAPDLEAARRVASHLGTTHHERVMSREDLARSLPEVVRHMEHFRPELIRHAIPTWHAAKLAREHVKVVLVGEGADELFGGYSYYKRYLAAGLPNLLHRELHRSTAMLHSTNLLRVDRMTMAHGLEARVPFLSTALVDLAMQIPVSVRLRADAASNNWVEKWILRAAFDDLLPKDILWRPKTTFSDGSGVTAMVEPLIEAFGARELAQESARRYPEWMITSDEEAMYHRLLVEAYGHNRVLRENCYSWAGDILRPAKKSKQKRSVWQRVRRLWTALRRSA